MVTIRYPLLTLCTSTILLTGFTVIQGISLDADLKKMPNAQCVANVMQNLPEVSRTRKILVRKAQLLPQPTQTDQSKRARIASSIPNYSPGDGGLVPYLLGITLGYVIIEGVDSVAGDDTEKTAEAAPKKPPIEYEEVGMLWDRRNKRMEFVTHQPENHILYDYILKESDSDESDQDWRRSGVVTIAKNDDGSIHAYIGDSSGGIRTQSQIATVQEIALRLKKQCNAEFTDLACSANGEFIFMSNHHKECPAIGEWLNQQGVIKGPLKTRGGNAESSLPETPESPDL